MLKWKCKHTTSRKRTWSGNAILTDRAMKHHAWYVVRTHFILWQHFFISSILKGWLWHISYFENTRNLPNAHKFFPSQEDEPPLRQVITHVLLFAVSCIYSTKTYIHKSIRKGKILWGKERKLIGLPSSATL